jgi:hypothetical protein
MKALMHFYNLSPLFSIFFIATLTISSTLNCMKELQIDSTKLSYFPTEAPDNVDLMNIRKQLQDASKQGKSVHHSSMDLLDFERPWERKGVCFRVAIKKSFGLTKKEMATIPILWCEDLIGPELNILNDYYEQTNYPHTGTLTVYYSKKNGSIHHWGNMMRDGRIRSKIGTSMAIFAHPLWMIQADWGDSVIFYDPKPQFTGEKGKNLFLTTLYEKAKNSLEIQTHLRFMQQEFNAACKCNIPHINLYTLIKLSPTIAIDTPDVFGDTPLMHAARRGALEIVKLLVTHKVELNALNNEGESALSLATKNKHSEVVTFLLTQGANQNTNIVKNNTNS